MLLFRAKEYASLFTALLPALIGERTCKMKRERLFPVPALLYTIISDVSIQMGSS